MPPSTPPSPDALRYWRVNLYVLAILIPTWFIVSICLSIVWAEPLNQFHLAGFPLGFWMSQQGAIYLFVLMILIYAIVMGRLDRKYNNREKR